MGNFLDIFICFSPFILMILFYFVLHTKNFVIFIFLFIFVLIVLAIFIISFILGFGNDNFTIFMEIIITIFFIISLIRTPEETPSFSKRENIFIIFFLIEVCIYSINLRLSYKEITIIEFINSILNSDNLKNFLILIKDEWYSWFKEICIAVIGGFTAGIFLNKFFKNK